MCVNTDTANVSETEDEIPFVSLYSEVSKLKDVFVYYQELLAENNLIASESSASISREAILLGEEIYQSVIGMLSENIIVCYDELIHASERCDEELSENIEDNASSDEYEPEGERKKEKENGCSRLKRKDYLSKWEEDVRKGGSIFDKYAIIDSWTYDRFVEARENFQQVTTRNLQQWVLAAVRQLADSEFKASERCVKKFKNKHSIGQ
ncbi:hypothetical protein HNY73_009872 [Argiope bruennichi]|uniref:Uncharacterized protein n=1 Tax=Argiope bruennichi TaxID=94029 RepID=A0A8T0FDB9_ARGBR|nr:hypothetical protein HNY73_009872 [Argiope bruennichi]